MKLAFCLFRYFPFGGLQRDFMRIAHECRQRGHEIHVYAMHWSGEHEAGVHIHLIKPFGITNHGRARSFIKQLQDHLKHGYYDLVIGFNKMPGLDVYYAADVCYQARIKKDRNIFYRLTSRYREWVKQEESVFAAGKKTQIFLISPNQQQEYSKCYQTEASRFHLLPPGIAKDRMAPPNAHAIREKMRLNRKIGERDLVLLMIGSGFKTKGVDRAVLALAALPDQLRERTHLIILGADDPDPFMALANEKGVADKVMFLGGRSNVGDFLLAADLLIHPAYYDNTGTVILEAIVAGLPVLTVDACGYAHYVIEAKAGVVLSSPFHQSALNSTLATILESTERQDWRQNALAFAKQADIYSLPQKAVDIIEFIGRKRDLLSPPRA
jgi:UDP-glucose:(heptosyl)LPS alpha-1,3-glucosyltransferase